MGSGFHNDILSIEAFVKMFGAEYYDRLPVKSSNE